MRTKYREIFVQRPPLKTSDRAQLARVPTSRRTVSLHFASNDDSFLFAISLSQFNVPSSVLGPGAKCRMRNNEWKISEFEPGDIVSQPLALMVLLTET